MSWSVEFRNVACAGLPEKVSLQIQGGRSALVVTPRGDEGHMLVRLITGLSHPVHGSVHVDGQDLAGLSSAQIYRMRQRIGIVPQKGGLVSNLKLWENMTLPLLYTRGNVPPEAEETALRYLEMFGYRGNIMALPAHLTPHEKRMAAFIRAALCSPQVMVYANCFDDLTGAVRAQWGAITTEFHRSSPGMTSICLAASPDVARDVPVDDIISLQ
ncbi:ATP-binding cassette domain-containing protein [Geobacter sp. FeAm09]|uniref:ATP-binding cassette domain-containing protein n=1 Tax=Geobacter sp. FeAm09 TaxID=2597769 RepID=UPI0011EFC97F|nr:ATP-binding cassette domain-containing protein [Geobacter sp. FeAm09]QEM68469.1 ATP-binding cassette domain-containing protein [Geobacter sp. FeAm09]